jgi:hypothetical protein
MKRNGKENSKQLKNFKVSQPTIFKKYGNYLGVKECDGGQGFPFLGSHGFGLEFKPHKVHIFELGINFYIKSSPKH